MKSIDDMNREELLEELKRIIMDHPEICETLLSNAKAIAKK